MTDVCGTLYRATVYVTDNASNLHTLIMTNAAMKLAYELLKY